MVSLLGRDKQLEQGPSFSLCSHLSHCWTTVAHFPVYSLLSWSRFAAWCPVVPPGCPAWYAEPKGKTLRRFEGAGDKGTLVGLVVSVAYPMVSLPPGPSSHTPDTLCRAEPKAELERGSVLSSVWEHLVSGSEPGCPCQEGAQRVLRGSSSSSGPSRRQAQGS